MEPQERQEQPDRPERHAREEAHAWLDRIQWLADEVKEAASGTASRILSSGLPFESAGSRRAPRAPQSASSHIISPRFHSAAMCIGVRWASVSASTSAPFDSSHSAQDKALPRTAQCKGIMAALPRRVISPGPSPASACIRNARGEQRSKGLEIAVLEGAGYGFMSTFVRDARLRVI